MGLNICFLDRATIASYASLRKPDFAHNWIDYDFTAKEQVVERLYGCDIAVVNKVELKKEQLQQLPSLKMIAVAATGTNVIDLDYCSDHNITVTNIRNYAVNSVPEHAMSLMLALRRNIFAYHNDVRNGEWQQARQFCFFNHAISDLAGSRLGIIGAGAIGKAMAKLGRAFGMEVVIGAKKTNKYPAAGELLFDELVTSSDIISLHCPLNSDTKNLISLHEFKKMKRSALLINTARGGIVNEQDLVMAIKQGMIAGAGFDVLSQEPPANDHPLIALTTSYPNFILTPHIAWAGQQAMQTLCDQLIDNIEHFADTLDSDN